MPIMSSSADARRSARTVATATAAARSTSRRAAASGWRGSPAGRPGRRSAIAGTAAIMCGRNISGPGSTPPWPRPECRRSTGHKGGYPAGGKGPSDAAMRGIAPALLLLAACARAPAYDAPAEERAIRQVIADMEAAWNRGDFRGYMQGFKNPDVVFVSRGQFQRDWQGTLDHYIRDYGGDPARRR